jgi:hypothetical protein
MDQGLLLEGSDAALVELGRSGMGIWAWSFL